MTKAGPVRVYKVGGPTLEDQEFVEALAAEVKWAEGPAALVHGGGHLVDRMLRALALESRFVDGRRETSPAAMDVVEMVLSGVVNKALAAGLSAAGVPAIGLSGRDGGGIRGRLEAGPGRGGKPEAGHSPPGGVVLGGAVPALCTPASLGPLGQSGDAE